MLFSMCLSIAFIVVDILSVLHVFREALPIGINPFWKVSSHKLGNADNDYPLVKRGRGAKVDLNKANSTIR